MDNVLDNLMILALFLPTWESQEPDIPTKVVFKSFLAFSTLAVDTSPKVRQILARMTGVGFMADRMALDLKEKGPIGVSNFCQFTQLQPTNERLAWTG
jgi:hypothetical protein